MIDKDLGRLAAEEFYSLKKNTFIKMVTIIWVELEYSNVNTSVVNKNLRVHDIKNLFINGSSVFATAGHAYPTLTITQLSLRLGDHISKLIN